MWSILTMRLSRRSLKCVSVTSSIPLAGRMKWRHGMGEELPYAFGPPSPEKPSSELLGELLLREKRSSAARAAFEASLQHAPLRTESLLGLARAEGAMGDKAAATKTWNQLLAIWKNADPDTGTRDEARRNLSALSHAAD